MFLFLTLAQQAQQAQQLFLREKGAAIYIIYQLSTINGLIQRKYFFSHFCLLRLLRLLHSIQLAKSQSHTANISSELPRRMHVTYDCQKQSAAQEKTRHNYG